MKNLPVYITVGIVATVASVAVVAVAYFRYRENVDDEGGKTNRATGWQGFLSGAVNTLVGAAKMVAL